MKIFYLLLFCLSSLLFSQKIKIVDAENGKAISGARIILENQVLYSNDDGFALINRDQKNFEVSAFGFKKERIQSFRSVVKLKRHYKEIKEVTIVPVDFKKIFQDVLKNYSKRYYSKPSMYDVIIKQKNFDNDKLHLMVVSEAKLWSRTNAFSEGMYYNLNNEFQMQLNNVKYLKKNESDSIFLGNTNEFTNPYTDDIFFNFELIRILKHLKKGKAKFSGKILSDEDGEKLISFKVKPKNGSVIEGNFKYNSAQKVITYYQATYLMEHIPAQQKISKDRVIFMQKYGDATLTYDFYSKDGKYIPSFTSFEADNYKMYSKGQSHTKRLMREMIFSRFSETDKKGLDPKVNFLKNIWENVPVKEDKESAILLSDEEQAFVNQK